MQVGDCGTIANRDNLPRVVCVVRDPDLLRVICAISVLINHPHVDHAAEAAPLRHWVRGAVGKVWLWLVNHDPHARHPFVGVHVLELDVDLLAFVLARAGQVVLHVLALGDALHLEEPAWQDARVVAAVCGWHVEAGHLCGRHHVLERVPVLLHAPEDAVRVDLVRRRHGRVVVDAPVREGLLRHHADERGHELGPLLHEHVVAELDERVLELAGLGGELHVKLLLGVLRAEKQVQVHLEVAAVPREDDVPLVLSDGDRPRRGPLRGDDGVAAHDVLAPDHNPLAVVRDRGEDRLDRVLVGRERGRHPLLDERGRAVDRVRDPGRRVVRGLAEVEVVAQRLGDVRGVAKEGADYLARVGGPCAAVAGSEPPVDHDVVEGPSRLGGLLRADAARGGDPDFLVRAHGGWCGYGRPPLIAATALGRLTTVSKRHLPSCSQPMTAAALCLRARIRASSRCATATLVAA